MMDPSKAGYDTGRHVRFTWSGAVRPLRSARPMLCRQFRPSPCPTHYGGRSATSPSADFRQAVNSDSSLFSPLLSQARSRGTWRISQGKIQNVPHVVFPSLSSRASVRLPSPHRPHVEQISPNKFMISRCTTAAFTLSRYPWASSSSADLPGDWAFYAISPLRGDRDVRRLAPLLSGFLQTNPREFALAVG